MIQLKTNAPAYFQDLADVVRVFYDEPVAPDDGETRIEHVHEAEDGGWTETCRFRGDVERVRAEAAGGALEQKRSIKRAAKTCLYRLLKRATGIRPPWGSLTGIRPTRLFYEALEDGKTNEQAEAWLMDAFDVTPTKASLLREIVKVQRSVETPAPDEFDLYVAIPFCPTRCEYCAFPAEAIGRGRLVEPYLAALMREIELTALMMARKGLKLRAGYVGGGTPTSLTAMQLDRLLTTLRWNFPGAVEWTVEAGRPDTITREKLSVLRNLEIDRICINPQTFNDETLKRIGRAHRAEEIQEAFELARSLDFRDINMDLIAALPGETRMDFDRTLDRTLALAPEGVTVHTLAVKRASRLHEAGFTPEEPGLAEWMVDAARARLTASGYQPYYLYRQKHMADNLENVGYAKSRCACLYNIDNMEETAPVLALGAGAITKWVFPREKRIERAPNVRNVETYIAQVDEMAGRKHTLLFGQAGASDKP
jgi:oxygen-independent coproporphyrinogen-3 oxidase